MIPGFFAAPAGVGPSPPAVQTVLSATNIGTNMLLVDSNTVESAAVGTGVVVSVSGKSSGKFYAEVKCVAITSTQQSLAMGLRVGATSLDNYIGQTSTEWGTWCIGTGGATRSTMHNAAQSNSQNVGVNGLNQTARLAVDLDAGKLWLSRFGNTAWIGSGDPASGTSPTFTFTPAGTYYLALCPRDGLSPGNRTRLRLMLPNEWGSAAPSGFGVWT